MTVSAGAGTQDLKADLVFEGGGVKGIALAGAVGVLDEAGYRFPRVAGSSAGAVVGCLVAALQHAGEPVARLRELVAGVDYRRFRDRRGLGRVPVVGAALAVLLQDGLYQGRYLERFLTDALGELGVRTFGDLNPDAATDPDADPLVVTTTDLSRRRLARLPWDLASYGLDPAAFPVARAVRASAAIPLFFTPVRAGGATWTDGSLLSDFPVGLFDRADTQTPRWPTFGVRLTSRPGSPPASHPVRGPLGLVIAAVDTLLTDQDDAYVDEPCTVRRTVFVPTEGVSAVDFDLSRAQSQALYDAGRAAAETFLAGWDFADYVARCRA